MIHMTLLHAPAEDLEYDRGSVYSQETDAGIHENLSQDCKCG